MELQLSLPLEVASGDDDVLRLAWVRSGMPMPYHIALQDHALAICLHDFADAMRRPRGGTSGSHSRVNARRHSK